jgi:hypothetical protein
MVSGRHACCSGGAGISGRSLCDMIIAGQRVKGSSLRIRRSRAMPAKRGMSMLNTGVAATPQQPILDYILRIRECMIATE